MHLHWHEHVYVNAKPEGDAVGWREGEAELSIYL